MEGEDKLLPRIHGRSPALDIIHFRQPASTTHGVASGAAPGLAHLSREQLQLYIYIVP